MCLFSSGGPITILIVAKRVELFFDHHEGHGDEAGHVLGTVFVGGVSEDGGAHVVSPAVPVGTAMYARLSNSFLFSVRRNFLLVSLLDTNNGFHISHNSCVWIDSCSCFSSLNLSVGVREQSFSKQEFGVSPARLHGGIEGLFGLFRTCQDGVQLLTHLLGHVKVEGMTALSLHQKHLGIAAAARVHCREREKKRKKNILGYSVLLLECCRHQTIFLFLFLEFGGKMTHS